MANALRIPEDHYFDNVQSTFAIIIPNKGQQLEEKPQPWNSVVHFGG
jgi:hypothetical protein